MVKTRAQLAHINATMAEYRRIHSYVGFMEAVDYMAATVKADAYQRIMLGWLIAYLKTDTYLIFENALIKADQGEEAELIIQEGFEHGWSVEEYLNISDFVYDSVM